MQLVLETETLAMYIYTAPNEVMPIVVLYEFMNVVHNHLTTSQYAIHSSTC